ncbi:MAG: recombinase family protein [Pseudomonadota bacterium]
MRAVTYSRYSDELQRNESIEDQIRVCKERILKEGWSCVDSYYDRAESGSSMILRSGVQALVQDALARKFDIVVIEDLDRLSRDQEDTAGIYKRLQFADVQLFSHGVFVNIGQRHLLFLYLNYIVAGCNQQS